jgi:hypothetical protein
MNERIEHRAPWIPWAITSVALVLVAVVAYGVGAHHEAGAVADGTARAWHYHGFGGIWLFILLFWLFGGLRRLWWGGYGYYPWRHGRYGRVCYDEERGDWVAWHRREHERIDAARAAGSPSPAGQGPVS